MPWFIFAFLTALFESAKDLISKRNAKDIHSYILCLGFSFFALPVVGIGAIFETGTIFNVNVLALSVVAGVLYASSVLLFMTALKHSDLSLSLPLLSISPVFLLILSPIMIGEVPRARGLYGVLFVIAGSYVLNFSQWKKGIFQPFLTLLVERGSRYMLVVGVLWSVVSILDRMGLNATTPIFWSFCLYCTLFMIFLPLVLRLPKEEIVKAVPRLKSLALIGLCAGGMSVCYMMAIKSSLVVYVVGIKRSSVLLSMLGGHVFFREVDIRSRILGALMMLVGMLLVSSS